MSLFVGLQQRAGANVNLKLPSAWQVQWSAMPLPPQRTASLALGNAVDSETKNGVHVPVDVVKFQVFTHYPRTKCAHAFAICERLTKRHARRPEPYTPPRPSPTRLLRWCLQQTVGGFKVVGLLATLRRPLPKLILLSRSYTDEEESEVQDPMLFAYSTPVTVIVS